jgi:hypothetical protein
MRSFKKEKCDGTLRCVVDRFLTASKHGEGTRCLVELLVWWPQWLLASVGIANAEGPVKLTDVQLDKVTAGATQTSINAAVNVAATATVNYLAAVNTAVAANVAVMGAFNNLMAADTAVAIAVAAP